MMLMHHDGVKYHRVNIIILILIHLLSDRQQDACTCRDENGECDVHQGKSNLVARLAISRFGDPRIHLYPPDKWPTTNRTCGASDDESL